MSYSIHKVFPTYIHCIDNILISDKLLNYCLTRPELDLGNRSNRGGKQSLDTNVDSIIKDLIQKIVNENIQKVCRYELGIQNYWINVNSRDNYNVLHCHPGATLAGVVYIQASEDSGDLMFYNSDPYATFLESELYGKDSDLAQQVQMYLKPKTGKCFIFPAHLMHGVEPNRTQDDRVSVSFNLVVRSSLI